MKRPNDLPAEDEVVDRLLRLRETKAPEPPCPELETIARVQDGGASPELVQRAGEHLAACDRCARALHLLGETESARARPPSRLLTMPRTVWAAAAIVLVVLGVGLWVGLPVLDDRERIEPFVIKGQADSMAIAVERGEGRFTAREGDRLEAGDRLGFFYSASRPGYLAFFNVDGSGKVTVLFPSGVPTSGRIGAGQEQPLSDGGVVRGGEGCEWLVAFFSDSPLDLAELGKILRRSVRERKGCRLVVTHRAARTIWVFPMRGSK